MNYQRLYTHLFNALTDAVEQLENHNCDRAKDILIRAQQETEEMYLDAEEEGD